MSTLRTGARGSSSASHLIELFVADPGAADRWANGENYKEFLPFKVRETIGQRNDSVYSWLSEVSHPRFTGFQMTAFQRVPADGDDPLPVLHMYIGGVPLDVPVLATLDRAAELAGELEAIDAEGEAEQPG